jgi:hypothetical protein
MLESCVLMLLLPSRLLNELEELLEPEDELPELEVFSF